MEAKQLLGKFWLAYYYAQPGVRKFDINVASFEKVLSL